MRTEDGYIVQKCLNGETEAFGFLVDKYKASVYAFIYARIGNFHDSEDLTQEVFLKAFRDLRNLKNYDCFLAWLYSISSNLCKNWIRHQSKKTDGEFIEDKDLESHSIASYHEKYAFEPLYEAMDSLPEMYRQALSLHYLGGMSTKEMARFVGTSPETIRKRLSKARSLLKEEMLAMMKTTFESQRLKAIFTFRIVEAIKEIKILPAPNTNTLPWGASLSLGILITFLSIGLNLNIINPAFNPFDSDHSAEMMALKKSEIPVNILRTSDIPFIASEQGDDNDKMPLLAPDGQGGVWTRKADMSTARAGFVACAVNGKIYAVGGLIGIPDITTSKLEEYDPKTDKWTRRADMPTSRQDIAGCAVNGKIYVIGGKSWVPDVTHTTVEEYDPETDKWTRRADMPTARRDLSAIALNGKIYAIGGTSMPRGDDFLPTVEEYDPKTDKWTKKADMPTARNGLSLCAVNGKLYAFGGSNKCNANADYSAIPTLEEYNPVSDTWTKRSDMLIARVFLSSGLVDGKIYAIGGGDRLIAVSSVEEYDPTTDKWEKLSDMPTSRGALCSSVVDGKIYAIGGFNFKDGFLSTVEEFDPSTEKKTGIESKNKLLKTWGNIKAN